MTPPPREAPQAEGQRPAMEVEHAPSGALQDAGGRAALGFVLESSLRARRIRGGRSSVLVELGDGAIVVDGDRLQISVRTSLDAYLYLAFCSQHGKDPRYPGLQVFPGAGAIRARAHETTIVPGVAAEIVVDDKPGQESLYLILSRSELSSSDSALAEVLAAARQGQPSAGCGTPFRAALAGSGQERKPDPVWSGKLRSREARSASAGAAPGAPTRTAMGAEQDPVVEIQRGGDIVWHNGMSMGLEADPDGIVILRYGLTHVAAP